jgi:hypothetical protein
VTDPAPSFGDVVHDEIAYVHERIDQLIRQVGLEVGMADIKRQTPAGETDRAYGDHIMELAKARFWAADDAAAERFGRPPREH